MRKLIVVTLALVLVMAFAMPASAAIKNTVHDFQSRFAGTQSGFGIGGNRGMCSYCHIPHSAKGDRLWPSTGTKSQANFGLVGTLCASCHTANINNAASLTPDVDRTGDVYDITLINHVLLDDSVYANATEQQQIGAGASSQFNQRTTWPYCETESSGPGTTVTIECSSCHNPHNNEPGGGQSAETDESNSLLGRGNDYLRSAMFNTTTGVAFCEYCHENKTRSGLAYPTPNTIGTGTHPVGASANAGTAAQADIHIESAERVTVAALVSDNFYDAAIDSVDAYGDDGPGMHLTAYSTGGVTCQTCHKVHGADAGAETTDAAASAQGNYGNAGSLAASDDGYANILAIENDSNGGTIGYTYPTERRAADGDYNDLCIDCHETTPSVGPNALAAYGGSAVDYANATTGDENAGGAYPPDSHPVNIAADGKSEVGFDLSVRDPSGWNTSARWAGANGVARWSGGSEDATAVSFTATGRWDGTASIDAAIPRSEIVCLTCHSIHDGVNGTPILRVASEEFCNDCHLQSVGLVSHPVDFGSAMWDNPDGTTWPNGDSLPLANYYSASGGTDAFNTSIDNTTDMACFTCHAAHDGVDGYMLRVPDDNSRICAGCHTGIAIGGDENPSNYIAEYGEAATARQGSHYTGTVVDTLADSRQGESRWAYTGEWTATGGAANGNATEQTSHWNGGVGGTSRLQCQSCHTPHNAAWGLVEANTYDGNTTGFTSGDWYHPSEGAATGEPGNAGASNYDGTSSTPMCNTPTSALLLGNNKQSLLCATCHWPAGTHVTTIYTVDAKPDPVRVANGSYRLYRDYTTRIESYIISVLHPNQEEQYNVYDLLDDIDGDGSTPESPTNFPPLFVNEVPTNSTGEMVCDSCHAPHGAVDGSGAFILEDGSGDGTTLNLARQRVATRNFDLLCWKCHDK